ncbi:hypothetical protein Tco_1025129 [Tanacetum coccineum]
MTTLVPCENRYVWTLESDGVFLVASIRKEIDGNRYQDVSLPTRWVKSVPIKVNIIAWKVKSNISRRGMDIIMCKISSWWNIDYLDVLTRNGEFGWFLFGFIPNSEALLRVYTMVCGDSVSNKALLTFLVVVSEPGVGIDGVSEETPSIMASEAAVDDGDVAYLLAADMFLVSPVLLGARSLSICTGVPICNGFAVYTVC